MTIDPDRPIDDSDSDSQDRTRGLSFHGSGIELFKITIVNLLLTIVTLGIYYFWARTRMRQYVYAHVEFEDDRFVYHGTGKELLLGWLQAMAFLIIVSLIVAALAFPTGLADLMGPDVAALFYIPLYFSSR